VCVRFVLLIVRNLQKNHRKKVYPVVQFLGSTIRRRSKPITARPALSALPHLHGPGTRKTADWC
jgi:hypothetical protein